ncbi:hypothetical protein Hanom_Chr12g01091971 [Helianthus anomalus]
MTLDLNLCLGNGMYILCLTHVKVKKQICLRASKRQVWGCDTWVKTGLMKFKELFGSFTGHRIEKRNIGTHYGSNGSETSKN